MKGMPLSVYFILLPSSLSCTPSLTVGLLPQRLIPTRAVGRWRVEEVFAYRREDVYEDDLLFKHRRAVPTAGRKVEHVPGLGDALLVADCEEHAPALDERYLLVRVFVRGRDDARREPKATHHHVLADEHLPLDALFKPLGGHAPPVRVLRVRFNF